MRVPQDMVRGRRGPSRAQVILVAVVLAATRGPTVLIEGARGRRYALGKESRKEVKTWQL